MSKKKQKIKKIRVKRIEKVDEGLLVDAELLVDNIPLPAEPVPTEPIELDARSSTQSTWATFFKSFWK